MLSFASGSGSSTHPSSNIVDYNSDACKFSLFVYNNLLTCLIRTPVMRFDEKNLLREGYDEELVNELFNTFIPMLSQAFSSEQELIDNFTAQDVTLYEATKNRFYIKEKITDDAEFKRMWHHAWGRVFKHMSKNAILFEGFDLRERAAVQLWVESLLNVLNPHLQNIEKISEEYSDDGKRKSYQLTDFDNGDIATMQLNFLQFLDQLKNCCLINQLRATHQYLYLIKTIAQAQIEEYKSVELSAFLVSASVMTVLHEMLLLEGKLYGHHPSWRSREINFIYCAAQAILELPDFDKPFDVSKNYGTVAFSAFEAKIKAYQTDLSYLEESWRTLITNKSSSRATFKKSTRKSSAAKLEAAPSEPISTPTKSKSAAPVVPSLDLSGSVAGSPPLLLSRNYSTGDEVNKDRTTKKPTPRRHTSRDGDTFNFDVLLAQLAETVKDEQNDQDYKDEVDTSKPLKSPRHFFKKKKKK